MTIGIRVCFTQAMQTQQMAVVCIGKSGLVGIVQEVGSMQIPGNSPKMTTKVVGPTGPETLMKKDLTQQEEALDVISTMVSIELINQTRWTAVAGIWSKIEIACATGLSEEIGSPGFLIGLTILSKNPDLRSGIGSMVVPISHQLGVSTQPLVG